MKSAKRLLLGAGLLASGAVCAQTPAPRSPTVSVRLTCLLVPFTPLLTLEGTVYRRLTLQGESNFGSTHGLNLKWYRQQRLRGSYLLLGTAGVRHRQLREDGRFTMLPYAGAGYAWAWGRACVFEARAGLGPTLNADRNGVYPVIKVGAGRTF